MSLRLSCCEEAQPSHTEKEGGKERWKKGTEGRKEGEVRKEGRKDKRRGGEGERDRYVYLNPLLPPLFQSPRLRYLTGE